MVADNIKVLATGKQLTKDKPFIGRRRAFDVEGEFKKSTNPNEFGFDIYDRMRQYDAIVSALILKKAPILGKMRQASVDCESPAIREFVHRTFIDNGLLFRLARTMLRAKDFGVAFHEKIWEVRDLEISFTFVDDNGEEFEETAWSGPAIVYKDIKEVNPTTVKEIRRTDDDGSFDGFVQTGTPDVVIPAEKSLIYSNKVEYGNMWGVPETRPAYQFFYWAQVVLKQWMAWIDKKTGPTRIVGFPSGTATDEYGNEIDNADVAIETGNAMDSVSTVALPTDRYPDSLGGGEKWRLTDQTLTDHTDTHERALKMLDVKMVRSMFVPERTYMAADDTGTYAEAQAHTNTFLMTLDFDLEDLLEAINRWVIPPLVLINFGTEAEDNPCRISVSGLSDEERNLLKSVFLAMIASPTVQEKIDLDSLAETFGVPLQEVIEEEPIEEGLLPEEEPIEGEPDNLLLADDVTLVDVDLSKYRITPDSTSTIGYKVINAQTGKRITGQSARNIVKAFQNAGKKAAKKAETESNKAQRKAESEAKKAATAARVAANKQAAEQRKAERDAAREGTKQEREAAKAERDAAREEQKAAKEEARIAKQEQRDTERQTKEKTAAEKEREAATIDSAKAEKTRLESATSGQDFATAQRTLKAEGWDPQGNVDKQRSAAVEKARAMAIDNPDKIVTVVKTKDGYMAVAKAKDKIKPAASKPKNVALDEEGADSSSPDPLAEAIWERARSSIESVMLDVRRDSGGKFLGHGHGGSGGGGGEDVGAEAELENDPADAKRLEDLYRTKAGIKSNEGFGGQTNLEPGKDPIPQEKLGEVKSEVSNRLFREHLANDPDWNRGLDMNADRTMLGGSPAKPGDGFKLQKQNGFADDHYTDLKIRTWAVNSAGLKDANELQVAAAKTFRAEHGVDAMKAAFPATKAGDKARRDIDRAFKNDDAQNALMNKAILKAQYTETQKMFADAGITHVTVYRGMRFGEKGAPEWVTRAPTSGSARSEGAMLPMSSWSASPHVARAFAGDQGVMAAVKVPVASVISTPLTGMGCLFESEVIISSASTIRPKMTRIKKGDKRTPAELAEELR